MKNYIFIIICFVFIGHIDADTSKFIIVDDDEATTRLERIVNRFLATRSPRAKQPTYANVCVLLAEDDGAWRRLGYQMDEITYPASSVKLAYLVSAMKWARDKGYPPEWIDENYDGAVKKMITKSDNYATGVVIDLITGTPNDDTITSQDDPKFQAWYDARLYTENYFKELGLLEHQTLVNKTYPTNSGSGPRGAEKVSVYEFRGSNRMCPRLAASLMLEVAEGAVEPQATDYMRDLLTTDRWGYHSGIGFGLPPGSVYESKTGWALGTCEDIAYIVLPNGRELVMALFTDAWEREVKHPVDVADLGMLAETILQEFDLLDGGPSVQIIDNTDDGFTKRGVWSTTRTSKDKMGRSYHYAPGSAEAYAYWTFKIPHPGKYEVVVRWPEGANRSKKARYHVNHDAADEYFEVDQTISGGRWVKLGDFNFSGEEAAVALTAVSSPEDVIVIADAVKLSAWPTDTNK